MNITSPVLVSHTLRREREGEEREQNKEGDGEKREQNREGEGEREAILKKTAHASCIIL